MRKPLGVMHSPSRPHRNDVAREPAGDDRLDVRGPKVEGLPLLRGIERAIIDARHARLSAAHVIERGLDDVRLHAEVGHPRGGGAAQIVKPPRRKWSGCASV